MICLLTASVALRILSGCSDPKFEAKQFERQQHLDHLSRNVQDAEARRPDHIQWVVHSEENLALYRSKHLEDASRVIHEGIVGTRRWNEFADDREWWFRHGLRGRPECIPNAWAKMVY